MASYTTNFLWNHPKPGDGLYDYSGGMLNTPDTPETLNFTKNQLPVIDTSNPQVKQAGMFPPNFWTGVGSLWGIGDMAANQYKNWMGNYNLANRNNLNLENYITLDGTKPVINEGQLLADTTDVTPVKYPEDNDLDANWQHQLRMQGIDRGNIDNKWYNRITTPVMGIMRAIGDKFQRSPEKQAFYDAVVGDRSLPSGQWTTGQYGGNEYGLYNSPTGLKVSSDIIGWGQGYEKNLDSMFGSKSIEEMEDKKIEWAMKRLDAGKRISQRLRNALTDRGYLGGDQRGDQRTYTYEGTKDYGPYTRTNVPTHIGPTGQDIHGGNRGRFDGAPTREAYDRDPTGYSGSFNKGGRVGLYGGGDPTEWMGEQETITPFQLQQEEGVPIGLQASDDVNTRILENLFEKYLDLGFSPADAEKLAMEEFESMAQGPQEEVVEEGIARLV
jgi:hypothetical protein